MKNGWAEIWSKRKKTTQIEEQPYRCVICNSDSARFSFARTYARHMKTLHSFHDGYDLRLPEPSARKRYVLPKIEKKKVILFSASMISECEDFRALVFLEKWWLTAYSEGWQRVLWLATYRIFALHLQVAFWYERWWRRLNQSCEWHVCFDTGLDRPCIDKEADTAHSPSLRATTSICQANNKLSANG